MQIFMTAFDAITRLSESLDDPQTMISPEKFGEMLLAWSDTQFGLEWVLPRQLLTRANRSIDRSEHIASVKDIHANIVIDILLALYDSERSGSYTV
jgi:condensin complex subunit 3